MRLLRAATLTTPDPHATMALYAEWLGYQRVESGVIGKDLATSWGAPETAGRDYVVARPGSGADVLLRFVAGDPPDDYVPLRSYGWAAIEICVQDTEAVHRRLAGSPFEIIGPPRRLDGMPAIFPMQVKGPDGEIVYLTQIDADLPECDLPRAASPIDQLFIAVLACSDLDASIAWFERRLGIVGGAQIDITYTMLAKSFGLPIEHKHRIAAGLDGRDCFLEFDQYPRAAAPRPRHAGALPPGIALTSLWHRAIDMIDADWITPPQRRSGAIYGGATAGTLRAPDDTLIEIIEVL
jgi:catechol 2,3-dioxygenase-like lactoylglutathione lyase family enzyme